MKENETLSAVSDDENPDPLSPADTSVFKPDNAIERRYGRTARRNLRVHHDDTIESTRSRSSRLLVPCFA